MKKNVARSVAVCLLAGVLNWSCSDSEEGRPGGGDEPEPNPFVSVTAPDGETESVAAVDPDARTVHFSFVGRVSLTDVPVTIRVTDGFSLVVPETAEARFNLEEQPEIVVRKGNENYSYRLSGTTAVPFSATAEYAGYRMAGRVDPVACTVLFEQTLYEWETGDRTAVPVEIAPSFGYTLVDPAETSSVFDFSAEPGITVRNAAGETFVYALQLITDEREMPETPFEMHRGVNLSYWMEEGGGSWAVDREKLARLVELGFDHFRIPVAEAFVFNPDGSVNRKNFDLLHEGLRWMDELGAKAIVDLHKLRNWDIFNDAAAEQGLYDCWDRLSAELKKYDVTKVAYELLNEPEDYVHSARWNPIVAKGVASIRKREKERIILISSVGWQDYKMVPYLQVPEGDPNLIVSFHYYNPKLLTHYGMEWAFESEYTGRVNYPGMTVTKTEYDKLTGKQLEKYGWWYTTGQVYDAQKLRSDIAFAANHIRTKKLRSYCGEFACSSRMGANSSQRMQWLQDMVDALDAEGMPYAAWENFSSGFGFSYANGVLNEQMVRILTGKGRYNP